MKKSIIALFIASFAALLTTYIISSKPTPGKTSIEEKTYPVNARTIKKQKLSPQIQLYGKVESPYNSTVSSVINADVTRLLAFEGQQVKKGQVLIRLDPKNIGLQVKERRADLASAKVRLTNKRKELARQESLFQKKIISSSAIDNHRKDVIELEAGLSRAQARLDQIKNDELRSKVVAPFSGLITKVHVSPGDRVALGTQMVSMYDIEKLEVRVQIPNSLIGRLRKLWYSGVKVKALINERTEAVLSRITGEVKSNSAGIDAIFSIIQTDNSLSIGRAVSLTILMPLQADTVSVPYQSLYQKNHIYLIKDNRLVIQRIQRLGQFNKNGTIQVLVDATKLENGDLMLLTQLPNALTGLKVKIIHLNGEEVKDSRTSNP